jgi:hypothetical protein
VKPPRLLVGLTLVNLALLVALLACGGIPLARAEPGVLRGRALEIVDGAGRVRASIQVLPADPAVAMPDGTRGYPETVILRLVTAQGRPSVKLSAAEDRAILVLGGARDPTYAQLRAQGGAPALTLSAQDGRRRVVEP